MSSAPYVMCSAVDFLPRNMTLLMKRASTLELKRGSGRICRFGGVLYEALLLLLALGAVLRAALLAVGRTGRVERTANNVIADARKIFNPPAAHQHDRVLLQVVPDAGDVGGYLFPIGQANARNLTERRVRLLRGNGLDLSADATALRVAVDFKGARG